MNNIPEILSTYERIMYGDLRPWIPENLNEEKFADFLHPSIEIKQPVGEEFYKTLEDNIKKHPLFSELEFCELEIDSESNSIKIVDSMNRHFDDLIDISIPPYFNDKTEYYYLVLQLVNGNILKAINKIYTESNSKEDFSFFINKLFGRLKHIINDTHIRLKSINYSNILDSPLEELDTINQQKKIDHYILYATKERLIQLMLEIHSFYNDSFNNEYLTDRKIYIEILHDHYLPDKLNFEMYKLEILALKNFIRKISDFTIIKAHHLINRNKQCLVDIGGYTRIFQELTIARNSLLTNILVLENLVFYQTYIKDSITLDMDILSDEVITSNWYSTHKSKIKDILKEYSLPIDAIDYLKQLQTSNNILLSDAPIHFSVKAKSSLIRKLDDWFTEQINFYKANFSINISQLQPTNIGKIQTNLSVKELAFLFKMLCVEKIIIPENQTELFKFIAANFSTKGKDDLSWKSVKNNFLSSDFKTADDWIEKFIHLQQHSKKIREKF